MNLVPVAACALQSSDDIKKDYRLYVDTKLSGMDNVTDTLVSACGYQLTDYGNHGIYGA